MQDEETQLCSNCEKPIPKSKLRLHEVRCARNTVKCKKCGKNIDKGMLEEHEEEMHSMAKCEHCAYEAEKSAFGAHRETCPMRPVPCEYCEQTIPMVKLMDHTESCGNKTRQCPTCTNFIKIKDWQAHEALPDCSHLKPKPKPIRREEFPLPGAAREEDIDFPPESRAYVPPQHSRGIREELKTNTNSRYAPRTAANNSQPAAASASASTTTTASRALPTRSSIGRAGAAAAPSAVQDKPKPRVPNNNSRPAPQSNLLSQPGSRVAAGSGSSSRVSATGPSSRISGSGVPRQYNRVIPGQPGARAEAKPAAKPGHNYGYPSGQRGGPARGPTGTSSKPMPKPMDEVEREMLLQYQRELDEEEAHKIAMQDYDGPGAGEAPSEPSMPKPRMRYPGIPDSAIPSERPEVAERPAASGYAYSYSGPGSEGNINELPASQSFMNAAAGAGGGAAGGFGSSGTAALYGSGFAVEQEDPLLQAALAESLKQGPPAAMRMDSTMESEEWKRVMELSKREK